MVAKGLSVAPLSAFYRKYAGLPPVLGQFSDGSTSGKNDKATAAVLTLADVLAPAGKTEIVPAPALDGRLLTIEQAGKRLNLISRLV